MRVQNKAETQPPYMQNGLWIKNIFDLVMLFIWKYLY